MTCSLTSIDNQRLKTTELSLTGLMEGGDLCHGTLVKYNYIHLGVKVR